MYDRLRTRHPAARLLHFPSSCSRRTSVERRGFMPKAIALQAPMRDTIGNCISIGHIHLSKAAMVRCTVRATLLYSNPNEDPVQSPHPATHKGASSFQKPIYPKPQPNPINPVHPPQAFKPPAVPKTTRPPLPPPPARKPGS